jgi:uncharacterized protein YfiM (DUF2279 family)
MYHVWYKQYSTGKFHTFNDNPEWEGMDKLGHAWTSYQIGNAGYRMMRYSGLSHRKSIWFGSTQGSLVLLGMEVLDGFSDGWGFSWGDIAANSTGTLLSGGQMLLWNERRIHLKMSFTNSNYAHLRPDLLGTSTGSQIFKDYNGQIYWLSAATGKFFQKSPVWLKPVSLSIGYGANGMVSGRKSDTPYHLEPIQRYRQLYLSLDIDWQQLPVKNKTLKRILGVLNAVKMPFPALEISQNHVKMYWLGF